MFNPVLRWRKSPDISTSFYRITWTYQGSVVKTVEVPKSIYTDNNGYERSWSHDNPNMVLEAGASLKASIEAVNGANLSSSPVEAILDLPAIAPAPPENVTLTLS
jgi:hypothetical protein